MLALSRQDGLMRIDGFALNLENDIGKGLIVDYLAHVQN